MQRCSATLQGFFGDRVQAIGKVKLKLNYQGAAAEPVFFVVREAVPFTLTGVASEELKLVKRLYSVQHANCNIAMEFKDIFEGVGVIKNVVYSMKVESGSKGIVKPARKFLSH